MLHIQLKLNNINEKTYVTGSVMVLFLGYFSPIPGGLWIVRLICPRQCPEKSIPSGDTENVTDNHPDHGQSTLEWVREIFNMRPFWEVYGCHVGPST